MGLGVRAEVAVVVAAAGRDEAKLPRHRPDRLDGGRVEGAVVHLEATEAGRHELAHDVEPSRRLAEMGEDWDAAGARDGRDRRLGA
jgi:hypothetical protein